MQLTRSSRKATQLIFFICGLGISSWAPMVPYAKERLQLNDASLGLLLLFLGAGAVVMMPLTGMLIEKYGSRKVILVTSLGMAMLLPLLLLIDSALPMGFALFFFGSCVGGVDVAMNAHAIHVQNHYGKHIMSSFHGLFSTGGLIGSLGIGFLMKSGLNPVTSAISISILIAVIVFSQFSKLYSFEMEKTGASDRPGHSAERGNGASVWLKGSVLFLGLLCFIVFLSEGAMLDWSAVFLKEQRNIDPEFAGIGYAAFSIAMAVMRLSGDHLVARFTARQVICTGTLTAALGLTLVVSTPYLFTALLGFIILGLSAANVVPLFFSQAGQLKNTPSSRAISAITTMGYAGQLAGPALLGFVAYHYSLPAAIGFIAFLLFLVCVLYGIKSSRQKSSISSPHLNKNENG